MCVEGGSAAATAAPATCPLLPCYSPTTSLLLPCSSLISITKYLSKYYKNKNLRINCISPGGVYANQPEKFLINYNKSCNSKGILNAEDINGTILFLLSKIISIMKI